MSKSKYENHFGFVNLLGHKVKDKVTGFDGVVTHVGYDLYGCIQAIVHPEGKDKDGEVFKGTWFDVHRLDIISSEPVMAQPAFVSDPEGADNSKPTK